MNFLAKKQILIILIGLWVISSCRSHDPGWLLWSKESNSEHKIGKEHLRTNILVWKWQEIPFRKKSYNVVDKKITINLENESASTIGPQEKLIMKLQRGRKITVFVVATPSGYYIQESIGISNIGLSC